MMEKRTKKVQSKIFIGEIVVILIIISTVIAILKLKNIKDFNKKIDDLEANYAIAKEEADINLESDKEKWNTIEETTHVIITPEMEETEVYNQEINMEDPMILRDRLKDESSKEFAEAIEWAEEQNRNYSYTKYSPFDKEGFVETYYTNANHIKAQTKQEKDLLHNAEIKKEKLYLAILLLIAELGILILKEYVEDKSKLSLMSGILVIFSVVLMIMGI